VGLFWDYVSSWMRHDGGVCAAIEAGLATRQGRDAPSRFAVVVSGSRNLKKAGNWSNGAILYKGQ